MSLSPLRIEMGRHGLGASEVASAIGLSPYRSPVQLAAEKLGLVEPFAGNTFTDIGTELEPAIAALYARREGIPASALVTCEPMPHPTAPHVFATPDRLRKDGPAWRVVEIKTASARVAHRWGEGNDEVPEEYLVQVQVQMACAKLKRADLVVLLAGSDLRVYGIMADEELQREIIAAAETFWTKYVAKGELPPPDGTEATSEYLRRRFPQDTRPMLPPTAEATAILSRLAEARQARIQAETLEREAENELKTIIGDAAGIDGIATWRASKPRTVTDWEAVARALSPAPSLIEQFTTTKPGARRFLPKLPKE